MLETEKNDKMKLLIKRNAFKRRVMRNTRELNKYRKPQVPLKENKEAVKF